MQKLVVLDLSNNEIGEKIKSSVFETLDQLNYSIASGIQCTANIILAQSTLFTGLFFHCPSGVIITLFYYLHEIQAKKCIISAIKLVKMAIFLL